MDSKILREATLAYQAVYDENLRQKLTEEQIWEQVENWVNSLLEEGHDLSDYTWEEMYEAYLNEMGTPGGNRPGGNRPDPAYNRSRFARPMNANTVTSGRGGIRRPQIGGLGGLGPGYRGAELATAAKARASQVGTPRQGTAGGPTVGGNTPIGPAKTPAIKPAAKPAKTPAPAATPPRPGTPGASSNVKQAPTAAPATPAPTAPAAKPKTPNPLMKDMPKGPAPAPKGGEVATSKLGDKSDYSAAATAKMSDRTKNILGTKDSATGQTIRKPADFRSPREKALNQSFDLFDVVLGHLLDEGYADTEDAALAIMANMSEQWKQSILEG